MRIREQFYPVPTDIQTIYTEQFAHDVQVLLFFLGWLAKKSSKHFYNRFQKNISEVISLIPLVPKTRDLVMKQVWAANFF